MHPQEGQKHRPRQTAEPLVDHAQTVVIPHDRQVVTAELVAFDGLLHPTAVVLQAQQARTCIFDRFQEQLANTLTVDREVRRREATSGVVGGSRVGTVICRGLEPVL